MANTPLNVNIPVRGTVLVRIDGIEGYHEVGEFVQEIPIRFSAQHGEVAFQFTDKMHREAVGKSVWAGPVEGVDGPTPQEDSVWAKARAATLGVLTSAGGHQSNADLAEAIVAALAKDGLLA